MNASIAKATIAGCTAHMDSGLSIAVYQPYFFPFLPYWQLLQAADVFVIGDNLRYRMRGFINRNSILLGHAPHLLSISIGKASPNRRIDQIDIIDDFSRFRRTLHHAYHNAPSYEPAMAVIDQALGFEDRNLARFLGNQIKVVSGYLGLKARITSLSELGIACEYANRNQRLYDCAGALGATRIINPLGSTSLYDAGDFASQGIALGFLRSNASGYPQHSRQFVPNLSIIDAMMNLSQDGLAARMRDYEIVDAGGTPIWK